VATVALIGALGGVVHRVERGDPATGDLLAARMARVEELLATIDGAVWLNQYANPAALEAHSQGTMREIAEALDHRVDWLFVAVSTTGTLGGCRRYVQQHGMNTRLVAVDADGSVLFGGDLVPDRVSRISELDTVVGCRLLARNEAIVAGASSGAVVQAFLQAAPDLAAGARVVLVLHDGGAPYLDTVYNDAWVARQLGVGAGELARRLDLNAST
jgi:cysteine synthase A